MDNGQGRARSRIDFWLPALLLGLAGLGWWWSVVSAASMRDDAMPMDSQSTMSLAAFLVAWVAMMAAMMLPGVLRVVGRHCRRPAPLGGGSDKQLNRSVGALVAGGRYGIYCLGSCWMLMLVLIAFGTMQLAWMLALAVVIWLEKVAPFGDRLRRLTAAMLVTLGVALLVHPTLVTHLMT